MELRTKIDGLKGKTEIDHRQGIVLLGSCFADNVGSRLEHDGFDVMYNPMGPLYNPLSLARLIKDLLDGRIYTPDDFRTDAGGVTHCLDFASRYQHADANLLAEMLNRDFQRLREHFLSASVVCITFGSSYIYSINERIDGVVGNCHKFPSSDFRRMLIDVDDITDVWIPLSERLTSLGKRLILTVSPIRHLADGLHGNQLSKARLLLACEKLAAAADYFPAYEIMLDDLRDYRFYDRDMKHPSDVACDYIYDKFGETYFSAATKEHALSSRKEYLRRQHRTIVNN